jgi:hypothetical protein
MVVNTRSNLFYSKHPDVEGFRHHSTAKIRPDIILLATVEVLISKTADCTRDSTSLTLSMLQRLDKGDTVALLRRRSPW